MCTLKQRQSGTLYSTSITKCHGYYRVTSEATDHHFRQRYLKHWDNASTCTCMSVYMYLYSSILKEWNNISIIHNKDYVKVFHKNIVDYCCPEDL